VKNCVFQVLKFVEIWCPYVYIWCPHSNLGLINCTRLELKTTMKKYMKIQGNDEAESVKVIRDDE